MARRILGVLGKINERVNPCMRRKQRRKKLLEDPVYADTFRVATGKFHMSKGDAHDVAKAILAGEEARRKNTLAQALHDKIRENEPFLSKLERIIKQMKPRNKGRAKKGGRKTR